VVPEIERMKKEFLPAGTVYEDPNRNVSENERVGTRVIYTGLFTPDSHTVELPKPELVRWLLGSHEYLLQCIEAWATQITLRYGLDVMFDIQWTLWGDSVLPGVKKLKEQFLGITGNTVADWMKDIQTDATAMPGKAFDVSFEMPEPDVGIMTFNRCVAVDQWEGMGRPDILEKNCHSTCPKSMIVTTKLYNPNMSAGRLVTYINAVHPLVDVFDGYLVHSRGAGGPPLSQSPLPAVAVSAPTPIRDDLDVPVLVFMTDTDVFRSDLGVRQPDTDAYRLWEVAGTAHFDAYGLVFGYTDSGDGEGEIAALATMQNPPSSPPPGVFECDVPINAGPMHWVMNAALYRLNRWVVRGTPPPVAPRLQTTGVSPVAFATDAFGNTLGGIRTPQVEAPIATLTGTGNGGQGQFGQFCGAFGTTVPFTESQLDALYKNHKQFAKRWRRAARRAVKAGFLLRPDARNLKRAARLSDIGR
jgi:hypothetical protein